MKDSEKNRDLSGVHLWLVLMKAFQAIGAYVEPELRKSCLGESDFRVLEVLLHKGPMPVNAIGPRVFLTPGSISTAVDRLFERGLVSRVDSRKDRRVRVVDLTPKGRTLISVLFKAHAAHLEELAQVLTAQERKQLLDALKKLGKYAIRAAPGG
jgi:MarR family 2-MHQ and catechol resistance regulon transcriptional repressor